jgi:predicted metalloenzyme YecM
MSGGLEVLPPELLLQIVEKVSLSVKPHTLSFIELPFPEKKNPQKKPNHSIPGS